MKDFINKTTIKFLALIALFVLCWFLGRIWQFDVQAIRSFFSQFPLVLSGFIFILLYVGTTTFIWFGPKDVLRVSSAVLFGGIVSTIFVWISEMINALIMFHLSRCLGREYVEKKMKISPKRLARMKKESSVLAVSAWRVNPLIPFRLMDLGYGLTQITFRKYLFGIVIMSFARIFWLQIVMANLGEGFFRALKELVVYCFENSNALVSGQERLIQELSRVLAYFLDEPFIMRYSGIYFILIVVVSVAALVEQCVRNRHLNNSSR